MRLASVSARDVEFGTSLHISAEGSVTTMCNYLWQAGWNGPAEGEGSGDFVSDDTSEQFVIGAGLLEVVDCE
jgi:hypothetical protein